MRDISVIAIKHDNQYVSSVCYGNDSGKVFSMLRESFYIPSTARYLVSQGDIRFTDAGDILTFYRDLEYTWPQCCPVLHDNRKKLITFAMSIGASTLFFYDGGRWIEQWRYALDDVREIA